MSMDVSAAGAAWSGAGASGASMRRSPSQKFSNVFDQIDTSGSGSITKSQFEQAFSSLKMPASFRAQGADAIFAKLDPNNTGSVSKQDFVSGMTDQLKAARAAGGGHRHRHEVDPASTAATPGTDPTGTASSNDPTTSTSATDFQTLLQNLISGIGPSGSTNANATTTSALQPGLGTLLNVTA